MSLPTESQPTVGDARTMILNTIAELRSGTMDVGRGMAIAANMKVLNESMQVEVNVAKMKILAQQAGQDFGKVVRMGTKLIGSEHVE